MAEYDSGNGTLRKGGYNNRDVADGHYNASKDNVCRAADYGTISPKIRRQFPLSKRRGGGANDFVE